MRTLLGLALLLSCAAPAAGQFLDDAPRAGAQLSAPRIVRLQVGMVITSTGSPLRGITGTTPVPIDWPEQKVKIVDEQATPHVRSVSYETVGRTTRRMVVNIPLVPAGETASALVTFEITRHALLAPPETDQFSIPQKPQREVREYLASSPYIETKNGRIRKLARQVVQGVEGDWQRVEAIYDWVRDNVEYQNGPLKGAFAALKDGTGDCEELTSLFIAMCRINNIPARTVWIPGHCYPEFYLLDAEGRGHWFPCQAAGSRAFGSMPEYRAILQKGDNFRVPEFKDRKRYVAEHLKIRSVPGGRKPKVEFVRKALPR